ncbi:MAG: VCBS repeat-containing protein, partial [Nitrosomonas sp.]
MSDPIFTFTSINPFGLSNVGGFANPTFGDIDGDGDLDAYVGSDNRLGGYNSTGKILFFENTGTTDNPVFAPYSIVPFRGTFSLASYPAPTLVDIDGDGDLDAFVGWKNGNIELNRNTGTSNSPDFNLDYDDSWGTFGLSNVGGRASPTFADIDGDGDLDAFVGNQNGDILFFTNTASVGTHVPEPAIPDDNILVTALNLSARAYSDAHHDDQSVINAVNKHIKNWKPLEATDLGFSATDSRFSKV